MTLEILFLFFLLVSMAYFFFTEKLPVDLTAFIGLLTLVVFGYVSADNAFMGFSSAAVITMLSIFFVSGALRKTGLADIIGTRIHRMVGSREVPLMIAVMGVAGLLSAFMNNVAATAVLLPAVASLCKKAHISPSRLFMPLSFGTVLGGTITMVGTPPNILAAEVFEKRGMEGFSLFDFSSLGLIILAAGITYMVLIGRRFLPDNKVSDHSEMRDLAKVYQLQEYLTTLKIPPHSKLEGLTLRQARIGAVLGIQVVGIIRHGEKKLAPTAETVLQANDELVVKGHSEELENLLNMANVTISESEDHHFRKAGEQVRLISGIIGPESSLIGESLRSTDFRHRYHMFTVGIIRNDQLILREIVGETLQVDDELLIAMRADTNLRKVKTHGDFSMRKVPQDTLRSFLSHVFVLTIPHGSPMVGESLGESRIGEFLGLSVVGVIRDEEIEIELGPYYRIQAEDQIFVTGERERVDGLIKMGKVVLGDDVRPSELQSEDVGVIEATLSPRSGVVGKTLAQLNFRDKYDLQVLAIWHDGRPLHKEIAHIPLKTGDALLLQGSWKRINLFGSDPDFVTLSASVQEPRRWDKSGWAMGALLLMIVLVVTRVQPVAVASFMAAVAVVLSGAITMEEAYRSVEWRTLFLVASILPVGLALEDSGAATLISQFVLDMAGPWGIYAILAGLFCLASLLSQTLDGAPAVVVLAPVALQTAAKLGISPYPLIMGISLSASAAFMTPFSHKANLLVMGVGGYKPMDYLKVGTPLTLLIITLMVILIPVFWPLEPVAAALPFSPETWPEQSVTDILNN
ncbi:MAG: SLC13 family permease [Acidobacteriota bacterium]|nr:SLC13 family permease [Acidobacteriota bacterium]